ncbi:hypothetical protein [Vreelandella alkaliphila]|uniref:Uncharacterized protein n=1 Tax=Vreelandella alkaliphila TaxID=272774 RepID=A0A7C9JSW4_9GAMM|nr:hypothetical protein [Halomonas alkaliphila]NDL70845.1 hypothetical protein [Halomonas alkaliphila]
MAIKQDTTRTLTDISLSRLCRSHAVERLAIESEIQTLMITAGYARDFLVEGLEALPEDFFTCIEEMKEVMESIDLKSLDFEQRSLTIKRKKRRIKANAAQRKETQQ